MNEEPSGDRSLPQPGVGESSQAKAPDRGPGLVDELRQAWAALPGGGLFLALAACWSLLFHLRGNATLGYVADPSLFGWLANVWRVSEDDQLGYLVPAAVLVLLWWKREEWIPCPKRMAWAPMPLLLGAVLLHLLGFAIQQTRLSVVAYTVGLYALVGIVWGGPMMRRVFFPMFLLLFMVPLGGMAEALTFPLRMLVTRLSVAFARVVLDIDVVRVGSMIFDAQRTFQYDVAPACSGIRSLIALGLLTTIYGFMSFQNPWKRLAMIVAAAPLAVLGNTTRIVLVIIAAEAFGQEAGAAIEQKMGFITFAVAFVGILALGRLLKEDRTAATPGEGA